MKCNRRRGEIDESKRAKRLAAAAGGVALFAALALTACSDPKDPAGSGGQGGQGGDGQGGQGGQGQGGTPQNFPPSKYDAYFDPPAQAGGYFDDYRVVGSITPPSWSWGAIELLEGSQRFRSEGYNLRTQKLRWQDTFQDSTYPLQTYFGELNQQLVDGFNLHYKDICVGAPGKPGSPLCPAKGPTRPEARFVLLHHGPKTASLQCDKSKPPVLLVHGALQNGNVWILPGGDDGAGNAYPGTAQKTGFVQALESAGTCAYAVTFGSFHGDNINQAIHVANAVRRVSELTGQPKVDVVAWSKGVLSADLYLSDVAAWNDWGTKYFEGLAAETAKAVPAFRKDVRAYVALSGPHRGIDLNFRHPFNDLLIYSTSESAPVGQAPVVWGWMSAIQCVTWGYADSPKDIFPNPNAYSVCENRGGTWPDYWRRIYSSNITGLDAEGKPVSEKSLKELNIEQGLAEEDFGFDKYNIAMWGSVDDAGNFVSAYLGQLQTTYDLRSHYPIPNRQDDPVSYDWSQLDTDEYKWRDWIALKTNYNPVPPYTGAGYVDDDAGHITCRTTAYDPASSPCKAEHVYYDALTAEEYLGGYATYRLMDGIGIEAVMEMGGNFIERLRAHGLSPDLDYLYVLHGTGTGAPGSIFEIDGMECPTCDPHGDGVLFDVSIAARDQLTQGWPEEAKSARSLQEGMPLGHLEIGASPDAFTKMIEKFGSLPK
jgi:triacylglycerol esterase/lipase EstA (alpha/beta hydrolase family)